MHEISINYFENDSSNLAQNQIDQRRESNNIDTGVEAVGGACNTTSEINNTNMPLLYSWQFSMGRC